MSSSRFNQTVRTLATQPLETAARLWGGVTAAGQVAFIAFILLFYGVRTARGDLAGWNDKPLIEGYVAGDSTGNGMFALHVLLAAIVTLCGLIQLSEGLRRRRPRLHRWSGRVFLTLGAVVAVSGAWLTLVRGSYLSVLSASAVVFNGVLILAFGCMAWITALSRQFDAHRRWALRTFIAVSGVWFLRVGIMGWILLNRGPVGMTDKMNGPADLVLTFGSYLIPLAVLELYLRAEVSRNWSQKVLAAVLLALGSGFMAIGVLGTVFMLWGPYVWPTT